MLEWDHKPQTSGREHEPHSHRLTGHGVFRNAAGTNPTPFRYTGQRQEVSLGGADGLYYDNASWPRSAPETKWRGYDPQLSRFTSPDTLIPQPGNVLAWDRFSYTLNNPVRYTDPSGHAAEQGGGGGGCGLITCLILNDTPTSSGEDTSSSDYKSENIDPRFDITLGGNNNSPKTTTEYQGKRPSVYALIAIGIPLTLAIVLFEAGLTYAEIQLTLATIAQPEIAVLTVPLGLVLSGTSLALVDLDLAYWSYAYRTAFSPESETVDFEILPLWGFGQ